MFELGDHMAAWVPPVLLVSGMLLTALSGLLAIPRLTSAENAVADYTKQVLIKDGELAQRAAELSSKTTIVVSLEASVEQAEVALSERTTERDQATKALIETQQALEVVKDSHASHQGDPELVNELADKGKRIVDLEQAIRTQNSLMAQAGQRLVAQEREIQLLRSSLAMLEAGRQH